MEPVVVCIACKKPFYALKDFQQHNATRHRDFQYQCKICGNKFRWSSDCIEHNTLHDLDQQEKEKKNILVANMVSSLRQDFDFCAKAVCALHRKSSSASGVKECDVERLSTLAKVLTDGDHQLQDRDIDDCKELAIRYSRELVDIYTKGDDPFFSTAYK